MPKARWIPALLVTAACGSNGGSNSGAGPPPGDDAPGCAATPAPLAACATPVSGTVITPRLVAHVDSGAMIVASPKNDPRLFVVEQAGAVRVIDEAGTLSPTPLVDLSDRVVATGDEQGLLGLAFHPEYACNNRYYVYYTTNDADVVAQCVNATCEPILSIPDFAANHNGGMMEFGADGYLYIGTGDGGGGGDPQRTAQDPDNLLGKILRIDVDGTSAGKAYGIPADNPYAGGGGAPEVFMRGLRNPWRWSFDKANGDMWIGDVGQGVTEEIDVLHPAQQNGANLGWSIYEGDACCATQGDKCTQTGAQSTCEPNGLVFPKDTRAHSDGWYAIIGGEVYRGTCYPDLVGWYFYTDNQKRTLVKAQLQSDDTLAIMDLDQLPGGPASVHADARGELYVTTTSGDVYHLEAGR